MIAGIIMTLWLVGASLIGMIYGWGLTAENWWAVALSYMMTLAPTIIAESVKEKSK